MKGLAHEQDGVAAVEFALLAPVLALLMIGMVNLSMGFNRKLELEQAANRSIEKVMQTTMTDTVLGALKAEAAAAAKVPVANVTVDNYLECNNVRQTDYDTVCPAGQRYSRYLTVKVTDEFKPALGGRVTGPNADGSWSLKGDAGIRIQ